MEHTLLIYGIIILWTFLEGETIVLVSGAAAASGAENIWLVVLCAWIGSFLGDQIWFIIARKYGKSILCKKKYIIPYIKKIDKFFNKYHYPFIIGYRFLYGVRNFALIVLGLSNLKQSKFFLLNFISAGVWATIFSFIGYGAEHILIHFFGKHAILVSIVILVLLTIAFYTKKQLKKYKEKKEEKIKECRNKAVNCYQDIFKCSNSVIFRSKIIRKDY